MTDNHKTIHPLVSIVIPTFDEKDNVAPMVECVSAAMRDIPFEIIFVDDDSPDGTADIVRAISERKEEVRLLVRKNRRGLAGACIEGILMAYAPLVAVIDSDLQHDESRIVTMYKLLTEDEDLDLIVGTRYAQDGSSHEGFSKVRKWGSSLATSLTKLALRTGLSDPMSGFFMVRRTSFITLAGKLHTEGFKILSDMVSSSQGKWKIAEVSYRFRPRQQGTSKMDSAVVAELMGLLLSHLSFGLLSFRFILFCTVGLIGVAVQLGVARISLAFIDTFAYAQTLGVFCAMTSNFVLNNILTYSDRTLRGIDLLRGLLMFYVICGAGAVANVAVADLLYDISGYWLTASLAGALISTIWNFLLNSLFTWKVR